MSNIPVMTFNGIDLSKYLKITNIIRPIGNERDVSVNDAPDFGVNIEQIKVGAKKHTIEFDIINEKQFEIERLKHTLAGIFQTDDVVMITYNDEPDKYYLGMVVGDISVSNIARWFQRGSFDILIPDGVSHATSYTPIDVSKAIVTGNKAAIPVVNNGNRPALPILKFTHPSENGYIGVVNKLGALEYGDVQEVDGFNRKKSVVMRDYKTGMNIISGLSHARKNEAVLNDTSQNLRGTISKLDLWGRPHLHLSNQGGTSGNNGSSLTWTIPNDANGETGALNEYLWWRQIFWAGDTRQYGFMKVAVSDVDGNFLYGVETFKRSNGLGAEYNFFATDGKGGYDILKPWKFKATDKDTENPFNKERGFCDMLRRNDMVQVYFWGEYKKIVIPQLAGKKSAKFHVAWGAVGDKPLVTHMYLDQIMYRKDFVDEYVDIPNGISAGGVLVLNSETKTAMLDGKRTSNEVVYSSDWPQIPPGKSDLEIYWSDFAQMPELDFKFRERNS